MSAHKKDTSLPIGQDESRSSLDFLPRYFRTTTNQKFFDSTIDQLVSVGNIDKVNAYLGRKTARAYTPGDSYLDDVSLLRESYKLEPAIVIKDSLDNVTFFKDYNDYINQLAYFNNDAEINHSTTNSQEFYAWEPHISWDKFINYREYYWMPFGPSTISVKGQSRDVVSTYSITLANEVDNTAYVFSPNGLTRNPTLKLYRGQTYIFDVKLPGQPIAFKTQRSLDDTFLYSDGIVSANLYTETGSLTFTVPTNSPDVIYYVSKNDINTSGFFKIYDITENTEINVESEILGKKTYKVDGILDLSNGMKVNFIGNVTPVKYAIGNWYVEGVGDKIKLIAETSLSNPAAFALNNDIEFDAEGFDTQGFDINAGYAGTKDYITINRGSQDLNPWSRYNRWVHREVIENSAFYNDLVPSINQASRATRPIIEFNSDLQLWHFGSVAKKSIDVIDLYTTDAFSKVEGSLGYIIDGIPLIAGMRVLFAADTDRTVSGRIFKVANVTHLGTQHITLLEELDTIPYVGESVLVTNGNLQQGLMYYYDGINWVESQSKTGVNQYPKFDVFNIDGSSYSDRSVYTASTFAGTKIFSYSVGDTYDSELGLSLKYNNIGNIGDVLFDFNLQTDTFSYQDVSSLVTKTTTETYLKKINSLTDYSLVNGWTTAAFNSFQPVIQQYDTTNQQNFFEIDVYERSGDLNDLEVKVFVDGLKQQSTTFDIFRQNGIAYVRFYVDTNTTSSITIETTSATIKKLGTGFYKFPLNLENNPQNKNLETITLGEIANHVRTISDHHPAFTGSLPGVTNLRDISNTSTYGTQVVQHSSPLDIIAYHFTNKDVNVVSSLRYASTEYAKFKRNFVRTITSYGYDGITSTHLDLVLNDMMQNNTTEHPYYLSDMAAFNVNVVYEQEVIDNSFTDYPLTFDFNLSILSDQCVLVYVNDNLLTHGSDYIFINNSFVRVLFGIVAGDILKIAQYEKTIGSCIPPTPTKLGLYPKFEPEIFVDNTYQTPTLVIKGHDGSITIAFNDFRDDLILELEKRIFNNIKVQYDTTLFDIANYVQGYYRATELPLAELNSAMRSDFLQWTSLVGTDYTKHTFFDRANPFTFNYSAYANTSGESLFGFWRGIFSYLYDTDRPHTTPWEMLGQTIKPTWWEAQYGPAPYTSNNLILWQDLANGMLRVPGALPIILDKYVRPTLLRYIPVGESGELLNPLEAGIVSNFVSTEIEGPFTFGDQTPTETAWRRSSQYPFALITALSILRPSKVFATCFDRSRQIKDASGQLVYALADKNLRFSAANIVFPCTVKDTELTFTSGLVNYLVSYAINKSFDTLGTYKSDLSNLKIKLSSKLAGFTTKEKFKLILDSRSPLNQDNVFIPAENYSIVLNTSSPIESVTYSGVIIEKTTSGFVINGYSKELPEFKYYTTLETSSDPVANIGGISESYVEWTAGKYYEKGQVVVLNNQYYRVSASHSGSSVFEDKYFAKLPALPVTGGRSVFLRRKFSTTESTIHYGAELSTIQSVVDFLLGYGQYLMSKGFTFTTFNTTIKTVTDWQTSAKEFVFWTTQQWAAGAVITLSPAAQEIIFNREYAVVDNLYDAFYGYSVLKQDGIAIDPAFTNSTRESGGFSLRPKNTADGIYHLKLNLVQKEHVLILDNTTVFNDIIYDQVQGYRQDRIKVVGYKISGWNGDFVIPGFVYDRALVTEWSAWKDYALGDTVKYKEFYYSAKVNIPGTETFNTEYWYRLEGRPESKLIPNWDYRAKQFTDFYDLDTNSFDVNQQKFAQHLIGYQKRQYLENIINDEVSQYKFYQGMIQEKGTQNSLSKLFDVLAAADKDSLEFYEEWAIRLGQYGANGGFQEIEYILDEAQFLINPQPIEIVNSIPTDTNDFVYRITDAETYIKADDSAYSAIPVLTSKKEYIRTAGYVHLEDINYVISSMDELATYSIYDLKAGDYFWLGFDKSSWNVYRFTKFESRIKSIADTGNLRINLNSRIGSNLVVGEYVGINNTNQLLEGIHKVLAIGDTYFEIAFITALDSDAIDAISANPEVTLFRFSPQRISSIDNLNSLPLNVKKAGEIVWVDGENNNWAVWKFNKLYTSNTTTYSAPKFAKSIAVNNAETVLAAAGTDAVYYYTRPTPKFSWVFQSQILPLTTGTYTDTNGSFGDHISLSSDGTYMFVSAPNYGLEVVPDAPGVPGYSTLLNQGIVAQYTRNQYGVYTFTRVIENTTPTNNAYFGYKTIVNGNVLFIVVKGSDTTPASVIAYNLSNNTVSTTLTLSPGIQILDIDVSSNSTLVISRSDETVSVYKLASSAFTLIKNITVTDALLTSGINFGITAAISKDSTHIAIGAPRYSSGSLSSQGAVVLFKLTSAYTLDDVITSPTPYDNEQFGYRIRFNLVGDKFVSYSFGGNQTIDTTIDNGETTFDLNSTLLVDRSEYVGSVRVYEKYNTKFLFAEELEPLAVNGIDYGDSVQMITNVYTNDPALATGEFFEFAGVGTSWTLHRTPTPVVNLDKIKSVFLYDITKNKVIQHLDYIDPVAGKIAGSAEQELSYKTYYDPATYYIGTEAVVVDPLMYWKDNFVGKLWWDLSAVKFVNPNQGSVLYKANTWNNVFNDSTVDIYEWVESEYSPTEWDALADTETGLSLSISGQSKYGEFAYSINQAYDNVSQTFKNVYYFWVKNKKTIPEFDFRKLSANDVASLISNPKSTGLSYITLLGANQFALVNCNNLIAAKNIAINIRYWTIDNTEQNIHSHYQLLADGDTGKKLPAAIEQKWFDSLIGYDTLGRDVPDFDLPAKLKYGILSKPRQSMFVNRIEALKQFIERTNSVLINHLLIDDYNLSILNSKDPEPSTFTGQYDIAVDTFSQLRFVGSTGFVQASAVATVTSGKITKITVTSGGKGYIVPPEIIITSSTGTGAKLLPVLNSSGVITSISVSNAGLDYQDSIFLSIRPFTVLVKTDETAASRWALYTWQSSSNTWFRSKTQVFDVTKHWSYADWYATSYSQFTKIAYQVDFAYELSFISVSIGEIVKIKNEKSGGWILLEKTNNLDTEIYSLNYKTIGRQSGTIQFNSNLYKFIGSNVGYDSLSYDNDVYDDEPKEELSYILNCIKNDLLIDNLAGEYNKLFFASLRYVFSEQGFVDWAFKTSFVKSKHNLGELTQKVSFQNDNLSSYEDYINEVKPYRTKIREFVSNYTATDNTNSSVTDFDLPAKYSPEDGKILPFEVRVKNSQIQYNDASILSYPYNTWYDNVGYQVVEIAIVNGGSGYQTAPIVTVVGQSKTRASAVAYLSQGAVSKIIVTLPGSGYLTTPLISFNGSSTTEASAVAILGSGLVRETLIGVKFDRTSSKYQTTDIAVSQTFTGTGSQTRFALTWPLNLNTDKTAIIVASEELLSSDFTVSNVLDTTANYIRYTGVIIFDIAPSVGAAINIVYEKDIRLLDAADRIQYYYNPKPGQIGKDLGQLMVGVDYGGVEVTGLDFNLGAGWDGLPWFTAGWDDFDETYTDFLQLSDGVARSYELPYIPAADSVITVYLNGVRIDDVNYAEYNSYLTAYTNLVNDRTVLQDQEVVLQNSYNIASTAYQLVLDEQLDKQATYDTISSTYNPPYDETRPWTQEGGTDAFNLSTENTLRALYDRLQELIGEAVTTNTAKNNAFNALTTSQSDISALSILVADALTDLNNSPTITNDNALMNSYTGDGVNNGPVLMPSSVTLVSGDKIIFRKSDSDGSFRPNQKFYDTEIVGGNFGYTTATGLLAEDINIDGDGFVTSTSSYAPEEVVSGQIVDAVDIQVYHTVSDGAPVIVTKHVLAALNQTVFLIGQRPNTTQAAFVKVAGLLQKQTIDYTLDFRNQTITFNAPVAENASVVISSMGKNGLDVLDSDLYIADGIATEFITIARWADEYSLFVTIDGTPATVTSFITDNTYSEVGNIGFTFDTAPAIDAVIQYTVLSSTVDSISQVTTETIIHNGTDELYTLTNLPAVIAPLSNNIIVEFEGKILKPADTVYFAVAGVSRTYIVNPADYAYNSVDTTEITVYNNGLLLAISKDYSWASTANQLKIKKGVAVTGDIISVVIAAGAQYSLETITSGLQIRFIGTYSAGDSINVTTFTNHNILEIERENNYIKSASTLTQGSIEYYQINQLSAGRIRLRKSAIGAQYVWLSLNNQLLTPEIDYILEDNLNYIQIDRNTRLLSTDNLEITVFSSDVTKDSFGFRIFKDMLNRTYYKRIDDTTSTILATPLNYYDTQLVVDDASGLVEPLRSQNQVGVVFIDKERIEYLEKSGNTLRYLRRGTLGTGTPVVHALGTLVRDQSASQTIPYKDETETIVLVAGGYSTASSIYENSVGVTITSVSYDFNNNTAYPLGGQVVTVTGTGFKTGVTAIVGNVECVTTYSSATELTFISPANVVGAYDLVVLNPEIVVGTTVIPATSYVSPGAIRYVQVLLPFAPLPNMSSAATWYASTIPSEYREAMDIEVFVAGRRLRKNPILVWDQRVGPDSPSGDVQHEAEFAVNATVSGYVRLTETPQAGSKVLIQKKTGQTWVLAGSLVDSSSAQANFIRSKRADLPGKAAINT